MTFTDSKQRFSSRVTDYVRFRPGYPDAALTLLKNECGLHSGHVIADVGSGTGFLSELFLKNGNRVHGVEPNTEMREAGEEYLASFDSFVSIDAAAEGTTLKDATVDFVTVGQAFHWFDPTGARREFARILKPEGWVVVMWNDREMNSAFATAYEDVLVKFGTDYKRVRESYPEMAAMQEFFAGGSVQQRSVPNAQILDWDGLVGRLRSSSYAPHKGQPNYEPMIEALDELFRASQKDGRVKMEYATHVYYGQLPKQN